MATDTSILEGWWLKENDKGNQWHHRYCKLFEDRVTIAELPTGPLEDTIDISTIVEVKNEHGKPTPHVFSISRLSNRGILKYYLSTEAEDFVKSWTTTLWKLMEKNAKPEPLPTNFISTTPANNPPSFPPLAAVIMNNTMKNMQRLDFAVSAGKWTIEPPPFIRPKETVQFGNEHAAFVRYKFVLDREDQTNTVKISWSIPGKDNKRTLLEEKQDGQGFYCSVQKFYHKENNMATWMITEIQVESNKPKLTPAMEARKNALVAELNHEAESGIPQVDNKMGINNYYYLARQWWEQGTAAQKRGDLELAYTLLLKYTTFILDRIPSHLSYDLPRFAEEKLAARAKCPKILQDLEQIQSQLVERKLLEESKLEFPSVPTLASPQPATRTNQPSM